MGIFRSSPFFFPSAPFATQGFKIIHHRRAAVSALAPFQALSLMMVLFGLNGKSQLFSSYLPPPFLKSQNFGFIHYLVALVRDVTNQSSLYKDVQLQHYVMIQSVNNLRAKTTMRKLPSKYEGGKGGKSPKAAMEHGIEFKCTMCRTQITCWNFHTFLNPYSLLATSLMVSCYSQPSAEVMYVKEYWRKTGQNERSFAKCSKQTFMIFFKPKIRLLYIL